jgi:hypothetical protein
VGATVRKQLIVVGLKNEVRGGGKEEEEEEEEEEEKKKEKVEPDMGKQTTRHFLKRKQPLSKDMS